MYTDKSVMAVILWQLDIPLPIQSVFIANKVVDCISRPRIDVLDTTLCGQACN